MSVVEDEKGACSFLSSFVGLSIDVVIAWVDCLLNYVLTTTVIMNG